MGIPLHNCNVSDMLIKLIPCCEEVLKQLANVFDPLLVNRLLYHRFLQSTALRYGMFCDQSVSGMKPGVTFMSNNVILRQGGWRVINGILNKPSFIP